MLREGVFVCLQLLAISYSRDLPYPGIKPPSLAVATLADGFFTTAPPGKSKGEFAGYLIKDTGGCQWCRPALSVLSIIRKEPWFSPALRTGRGKFSRRGRTCLTLCSISGYKLRGSEETAYKCLLKRQSGISNVEFASEHFVKSLAHSMDKYLLNEWLNKSSRAAIF